MAKQSVDTVTYEKTEDKCDTLHRFMLWKCKVGRGDDEPKLASGRVCQCLITKTCGGAIFLYSAIFNFRIPHYLYMQTRDDFFANNENPVHFFLGNYTKNAK